MFICTNKIIKSAIKLDFRFFSLIKKYKKPIVTQDEQIIPDEEEPIVQKTMPTIKRGTNFFELYSTKSIERLSENDERLGLALLKARSLSDIENNSLIMEGVNMIRDAIKLNAEMSHLFFTQRELLRDIPLNSANSAALAFYVNYRTMKKFSNLKTPPGIMAIFKRPESRKLLVDPFLNRKLPVTLIIDNVRDPGNLGSIIRTAAAFNVHKILMTKGCVDLYNDKVLRGSMASIFCIPIFQHLVWDDIQNSLHPDCIVHFADVLNNSGDSYPYYESNIVDFKNDKTYALVIGGEINGVSDEARRLSEDTYGCRLHIPIIDSVNSLNMTVAAAIILAEFQKIYLMNKY